jgi:hypothetical protein
VTTETEPRMTVAEIALMREIVRWRKNHDIDFVRRIVPYGAPYWKDYRSGQQVWFQPKEASPLVVVAGRYGDVSTVPANSVAQAVDALVAYGYLPQRFSSAYREGFDNGRAFQSMANNYQAGSAYAQSLHPAGGTR